MKAAIIGGGVIGGGWASRFLLNGYDVKVYDPDKEAKRKLNAMLKMQNEAFHLYMISHCLKKVN